MPGPVNRFPGDLAWQLTRRRLEFFLEIAGQYGDAVSYELAGRQFFLFTHPDAIREVLITNGDAFNKGPLLRRSQSVLGEGLLTSEGDFHRRQRRLAQPIFHPQRMAAYTPIIVDYATRTADRWCDGKAIDVHEEMMRLALQIVSKTLFGAEVEGEIEEIGRAMEVIVGRFTRLLSPFGRILNWLPLPGNFAVQRSLRRLHQTLDRFITERQLAPDVESRGRLDLVTLLSQARDSEADDGAMSERQLRDECMTIFTAGHETTANALTFTFFLLAKNPEAEAKVHAELDAVLNGRAPTADDLDRLVYTRAAVAESMRLYPPAWSIAREATRDVEIAGQHVPAEAIVIISQWVTHRDPRWWPDPESFSLERWTAPDPARPRWAYFPFGGGARQCIGESFAWTEATLALATLAQRWRVEMRDPHPPKLLVSITLRPKHGLAGVVRART
jgi:cytochrome P450